MGQNIYKEKKKLITWKEERERAREKGDKTNIKI